MGGPLKFFWNIRTFPEKPGRLLFPGWMGPRLTAATNAQTVTPRSKQKRKNMEEDFFLTIHHTSRDPPTPSFSHHTNINPRLSPLFYPVTPPSHFISFSPTHGPTTSLSLSPVYPPPTAEFR